MIKTTKIGAAKIGAAKIGAAKIGAAKIGAAKIGAAKIGVAKIGAAKIGVAKIWTTDLDYATAGLSRSGLPSLATAENDLDCVLSLLQGYQVLMVQV